VRGGSERVAYHCGQFRDLISRVLTGARLYSPAAVNLLLGTAAQESQFGTYLRQLGKGEALSAFQIEEITFRDLRSRMDYVCPAVRDWNFLQLEWDLRAAIVVARLKYRSIPAPLPAADNLPGLAAYWKSWYNTPAGAGTVEQFIRNYRQYVTE